MDEETFCGLVTSHPLLGDAEWDNKIRKSACAGYASELLLLVLRYAESVDYLKIFQDRLLAISSQGKL